MSGRRILDGTKRWLGAALLIGVSAATSGLHGSILQVLDPEKSPTTTTREAINVMGRVPVGAKVTVGGVPARTFPTGIFVRDQVPVKMGINAIEVLAETSTTQQRQLIVVERVAPPGEKLGMGPRRLRFEERSFSPPGEVILSTGQELEVGVEATPGQRVEFRVGDGPWLPMVETLDEGTTVPTGHYRGVYVAPSVLQDTKPLPIELRLRARSDKGSAVRIVGPREVRFLPRTTITLWRSDRVRLVRTKSPMTALVHGLHDVRLGGPYLTELPEGIPLRVDGKREGHWHVVLTPTLDAWVSAREVEPAAPGTPPPHLYFTNVSVAGDAEADSVTIPVPSTMRVPFALTPTRGPEGRAALWVDFFGAHHAATWISHRPTAQLVREVTVEQVSREHVRVEIDLAQRQLWGYRAELTTNALVVRLRRPPKLVAPPASPLQGVVIALEAGHGGSNTGARGVSGSLEKDVNRAAVEELGRQLEAKGARVVYVRPGDTEPSLVERARRATDSGASLFVSVHANSADQTRGYLRVSGTSTYYKYGFSRDLADAIHARLLQATGLSDFGNVGNFNYLPIRQVTWMPAVLVEQAFMSNPEDEAKMLDPSFRARMMGAVVQGLEDWLTAVRALQVP